MVDCGPVAPWTCPNEVGCPHGIVQHRYEPDRERWVCTVEDCWENPYRGVRVSDLSGRSMSMASYAGRMASLRAAHGPEVTFVYEEYPLIDAKARQPAPTWARRLVGAVLVGLVAARWAMTAIVGLIQLERFMCTTWTDALRQALKDGGWAKKEAEQEVGGCFLVGVSGRLFRVDSDYQVGEVVGGYDAIGSGEQPALGALAATTGLKWGPKRRMRAALEAAERHIVSVRGPFHYVWETP